MSNYKSIQFILQELTNNAEDRERFDQSWIPKEINLEIQDLKPFYEGGKLANFELIELIRTALSRIDGKAVLGALEGDSITVDFAENEYLNYLATSWGYKLDKKEKKAVLNAPYWNAYYKALIEFTGDKLTDYLYSVFDTPLRNGEGLEKALTALDQYFVEEAKIVKLNIKYLCLPTN